MVLLTFVFTICKKYIVKKHDLRVYQYGGFLFCIKVSDQVSQWIVAQFRLSCGSYASDEWFKNFVEELMIESDDFKKWRLDHNVNFEEDFQKRLSIESIGELVFDFTSFDLSSNPQIKIAVHTPANSETSGKIKMLLTN